MKILVIGAGMYVTGRNNTGPGTILSALAEYSKKNDIEKVIVAAKSRSNESSVNDAINRINSLIGSQLKLEYVAVGESGLTIKDLLKEEQFDCAIVSVPDHMHYSIAKEIISCGVHCLVVKPLTPTLDEAKELVDLCEKNNVYGAVELHKRYDASNLYTKKILREKQLGSPLYITVDYSQRISIPTNTFSQWVEKTNIFQYLGVHYVDLTYFLTGYLPLKLSAVGTEGVLKSNGIDTYDSIHVILQWYNPENPDEKLVSIFNTNWIDPNCTSAMSDQKYSIIGTKGRLACDQKNRGIELINEDLGIQAVNPYFSDYLEDANGNVCFQGYGNKSIQVFLDDIGELQNDKIKRSDLNAMRPSFDNALVSVAVTDAVNKSLELQGGWVDVENKF